MLSDKQFFLISGNTKLSCLIVFPLIVDLLTKWLDSPQIRQSFCKIKKYLEERRSFVDFLLDFTRTILKRFQKRKMGANKVPRNDCLLGSMFCFSALKFLWTFSISPLALHPLRCLILIFKKTENRPLHSLVLSPATFSRFCSQYWSESVRFRLCSLSWEHRTGHDEKD